KQWMIANNVATNEELEELDEKCKKEVLEGKKAAWNAYLNPIKEERNQLVSILISVASNSANKSYIEQQISDLNAIKEPIRKDILSMARKVLRKVIGEPGEEVLKEFISTYFDKIQPKYSSITYSDGYKHFKNIQEIKP